MRVGFDIHGVLDTYPDILIPMIDGMKNAGIEICIVSGPPREEIIEELHHLGLFWRVELKNVFSVVDFLKESGAEMWQDAKGDWWSSDEDWWSSKARICKENNIKVMIDDSIKYKPGFDDVAFTFVHISDIIKPKCERKAMKITEKEHNLLGSIINSEFHDGRPPVNSPVWVEHLDTYLQGRSKAGVISSLTKKGLVSANGETISITEEGIVAYNEHE